jgi:hypothetical protein
MLLLLLLLLNNSLITAQYLDGKKSDEVDCDLVMSGCLKTYVAVTAAAAAAAVHFVRHRAVPRWIRDGL